MWYSFLTVPLDPDGYRLGFGCMVHTSCKRVIVLPSVMQTSGGLACRLPSGEMTWSFIGIKFSMYSFLLPPPSFLEIGKQKRALSRESVSVFVRSSYSSFS